ncbi:MAG TPA: c-type cytochrome [Vicinamibacteria bacterium]
MGVLVGAVCVAAVAPPKPDPAAAAQGKVTYARYCASCHGPEAAGDGPLAADLRVPPPDLTLLSVRSGGSFPFEAVAKAIDGRKGTRGHGSPDMPVWGEVFARTQGTDAPSPASAVGRITHYLWTLQRVRS